MQKLNGAWTEKIAALLTSVEYYLAVRAAVPPSEAEAAEAADGEEAEEAEEAERQDERAPAPGSSWEGLEAAVAGVLALDSFLSPGKERPVKKGRGKKKVAGADVRPALLGLAACADPGATPLAAFVADAAASGDERLSVLRFSTQCAAGNPVLNPRAVVAMLNSVGSGGHWAVAHVHRSDLALAQPAVPPSDYLKLRSLLRMDGHHAAQAQFGSGPWVGGLERRIDVR